MTSTSSLTIILLAVVKYIKLSRSLTFDTVITKKRLWLFIILTWIVPGVLMSPYLMVESYRVVYVIFTLTLATLILLPVFYLLILFVYKKSRKQVGRMMAATVTQRKFNRRVTSRDARRLVRRSLWLIGVYFMCSVLTIFSISFYALNVTNSGVLFRISSFIFLGNSCCNPCIYMFTDPKIWKISKELFKKGNRISAHLNVFN